MMNDKESTIEPQARTAERGAALVIVLIALVGLTILGGAGMALTKDDVLHSENVEVATGTYYAADDGLMRYVGSINDGSTAAAYTIGDASVSVTPRYLANMGTGRAMYRIRSVATTTDARGATTSRAVSALAFYASGEIKVKGAFTAASGMLKNGGSGEISGEDLAPGGDPACPGSPGADVAGVVVPPGEYLQSGGTLVPDGDPPVDDSKTAEELLEEIGINWEAVTADGLTLADYTIPPDTWPTSFPDDEWPVIFVDGNHSVGPSDTGQGTVIVTGNLEMNGGFNWDGIILVGGYITSNGYQTVAGATVTGLNELLGETVPSSDIGNGNKEFLYDSCKVKHASKAAFGGLALVPGSWREEI